MQDSGHASLEPGLRERKRLETRHALEAAALDLALENGIANLTVDQVVDRANLSRRTFFNYFASLSDALIGRSKLDTLPNFVDLFRAVEPGTTVFAAMKRLVLDLTRSSDAENQLLKRRVKVVKANPQLVVENLAQVAHLFELIAGEVSRRLADERGVERSSSTDTQARLLFLVCAATLQHGIEQFAREPEKQSLTDSIQQAFATLEELKEHYL